MGADVTGGAAPGTELSDADAAAALGVSVPLIGLWRKMGITTHRGPGGVAESWSGGKKVSEHPEPGVQILYLHERGDQ